ncbi:ogr/Delta-like zinc finger family protein [Ignatzschineria rhizosphaerae]|uniref:ogr/Delta-like zinc finger family protein n=1 Tax=Ignatzschineria rhizosphaerae TaxID=2923279 RepID=UPI003D8195D4
MRDDRRNRFSCSNCGQKIFVKYTETVSEKSRIRVYECQNCNMNLKSIEEIYQTAEFKPLL